MLKIGDFSQLGQVSVRTLRLYDELGLLKPAKTDRFTEYRYYTVEQLPRLNRILALKDLGFSLEQIGRLLADDVSADQLQGMLRLKEAEIEQQVLAEQARLQRIRARLRQIEGEGRLSPYAITLKSVEPTTIFSVRQIVPTLDDMTRLRCQLYQTLYAWLSEQQIKPFEPELALYHNAEYTEENIDMEAAVVVKPPQFIPAARAKAHGPTLRELPAVATMASVIHHGRFADVCDAIVALYSWVGMNGYATTGPYREIHLFGQELTHQNFDDVVLEVQVPIAKA